MDPQWILAASAVVGLLITWTTSFAGAIIWITNRLDTIKTEILEDMQKKHEERTADFNRKHDENTKKVAALETLVIRHDTMLDAEWNGGSRVRR